MRLELVTLNGKKMDEDVYEVLLSTLDGDIGVLPGHERLVTVAVAGVVSVRKHKGDADDAMNIFAINGGVVEISPTRITILVDEADAADEIVESEAQAALERAEKLKAEAKDQVSISEAQALVNRHAVRLKVAGLRRRRR